jgi:multidrug efflux pump subunit AcrA (membrane-fusion protein)
LSLATLVAFFPVAQQVSVTASLQPLSKQMYYAPAAGIVSEVLVDEGDTVHQGTPLLRLTSHELEAQLENLQIELKKNRGQIEERTSRLNRGNSLTAREKDLLEFERREYLTTEQALELQRSELSERLAELSIVARQPGTIATWDLRNRLLHHPVQAGQLLTSTFDAEDKWRLQLSIPDYRVGLVATALERSPHKAVPVHFSLTSYPDQVLEAFAVSMAPQVTTQYESAAVNSRVVRTEAIIPNTAALPLKKDGAIARATLDCGKTPLCWLVFRDAYWALSSRLRMLW